MSRNKLDVTVNWSAPETTGSSAITSYVVQANGTDKCTTATGSDLSCTIPMTVGTYTFTVQAVNDQGRGPASAESESLAVVAPPTVARNVSTVRSGRSVTVSWTAPESAGGLPLTYEISGLTSGAVSTTDLSTTFSSLTVGETYTFTVTARNTEGSADPVATSPVTIYIAPTVAQNVTAVRSGQSVLVSWDPPSDSGGLSVAYDVFATPSGTLAPVSTTSTSYTFSNPSPGVVYTFWVMARNAEGSAAAESSSPVVIYTAPSEVRQATALATSTAVTVSWLAPVQTGGLALSYVISGGPSGDITTTSTSHTFSSLQQGVAYSFSVVARNSEGSAVAVVIPPIMLLAPAASTTSIPSPTTTAKPSSQVTKVARGSRTLLSRVFVVPKGATKKWYASGPCYISSTKFVATRTRGTCKLTLISTLKGVRTRKVFSIRVV